MDLKDELQLHFMSRTEFEEISAKSDPVEKEEIDLVKLEITQLKQEIKQGKMEPILAKMADFDEKVVSTQNGIEILTKTVQTLSDFEKIFENNMTKKMEEFKDQMNILSEKVCRNDELGTVRKMRIIVVSLYLNLTLKLAYFGL